MIAIKKKKANFCNFAYVDCWVNFPLFFFFAQIANLMNM